MGNLYFIGLPSRDGKIDDQRSDISLLITTCK